MPVEPPPQVPRLRSTCSVLKRERKGSKKASGGELLSEHVRVWTEKKVASGVPETECVLPFLAHAPKLQSPPPSPFPYLLLSPLLFFSSSSRSVLLLFLPPRKPRWGRLGLPVEPPPQVPRLRSTSSVLKRERKGSKNASGEELLSKHVRVWTEKKVASGVPETECVLPFLAHAP